MARQVAPDVARQGEVIDTFPFAQKGAMLRTVDNLEHVMRNLVDNNQTKPREIVYTFIPVWGKPTSLGTWQIVLMP